MLYAPSNFSVEPAEDAGPIDSAAFSPEARSSVGVHDDLGIGGPRLR